MKLLIIDDEANMCHMLKALLERQGYEVATASDGAVGLEMVRSQKYDFILCDVRMPVVDGLTFLRKGGQYIEASTVIMMSAYGSIDLAVEAMKEGAYDFISKPFKTDEVLLTLKKAEERECLKRENQKLKNEIAEIKKGETGLGKMVGASAVMVDLYKMVKQVAAYKTTVLITGESGTGKELVARAVHSYSDRSDRPFVAVNCGSIPEHLLESELFGYVRGAFTGADRNKKGLFEEADGTTLFLDEIGELPLPMQVKLLRVLQENEIRPVGSSITRKVDCRIIAATAAKLEKEVADGRFREDLFYRLNVMSIKVPPLRERKEDLAVLCHYFVGEFNRKLDRNVTGLSTVAMQHLHDHLWPGNVRELENVIQRGIVLTNSTVIETKHLPKRLTLRNKTELFHGESEELSLKCAQAELEKKYIAKALYKSNGNKSKAALLLKISYPSLLNKIKEYHISVEKKGENPEG